MPSVNQENSNGKIPIPLRRRLFFWKRNMLPKIAWGVVVGLLFISSYEEVSVIETTALVDLREMTLAPLIEGRLHGLAVEVLDEVNAGDVVALMDDTLVKAELITADAELGRLRAELDAGVEQLRLDTLTAQQGTLDAQRRFAWHEETARLDMLERMVQQESDRIRLQWLKLLAKRNKEMVDQGLMDRTVYDDVRLQYDALQAQIEQGDVVLASSRDKLAEAASRRAEFSTQVEDIDVERLLNPLREAIHVQETVLEQIRIRRESLVMRSPARGQIVQVLRRPGETVLPGDPVMTLSPKGAERIVAYLSEREARAVTADAPVEISSPSRPELMAKGKVLKKGNAVVQLPLRLLIDPNRPMWGVPVTIGSFADNVFVPGEMVRARIHQAAS